MPPKRKLTLAQQRKIVSCIPPERLRSVATVCNKCNQHGEGVKSAIAKARSVLGPIAQELGPTVMKEIVLPMLLKKLGASGEGSRTRVRRIRK